MKMMSRKPAPAKGGGSKLKQLWEDGKAGKRDFVLADGDATELLDAFVQSFPNGASKDQILADLGGTVEDGNGLITVVCRYLTRHISTEKDAYVVRLFSGEEGSAAARNCRMIARIVIPGLLTPEDLQPVCDAGVPSAVVKLLVRMQTMAVLIESGRSSDRAGVASGRACSTCASAARLATVRHLRGPDLSFARPGDLTDAISVWIYNRAEARERTQAG